MHEFLLKIADPVGIIGVVILLIAYYNLSIGKWVADSMLYHFYNFLGAWLIIYSLCFYWNLASASIEAAWVIISMIGMYRTLRMKKSVV